MSDDLELHAESTIENLMAKRPAISDVNQADPGWTFLTNHAHLLLCIARDPEVRLRDLANQVGITERAAHRIVVELEDAGYISRERSGRRNHYELHPDVPLRHPIERHRTAAALIALLRKERRRV